MSNAPAGKPLRPHPAVETVFFAMEAVLWDGRNHQVHHFNLSASAVWLCVNDELTADQIAAELSEIFETPREVVRSDVDDALAEFVRLGLLDGDGDRNSDGSAWPVGPNDDDDPDPDDAAGEAPKSEGLVVLARPPDP